ncbi:MAG TPA: pyridoxamine 5'-phosphate oxidase family protein [Kofleriaceae bacterium]|nr:pyridoxamine 5'-phosphate oxidase family protein [Kofleriaceae bacterium]
MESFTPSPRTRLRRLPARGSYDRELVAAILDEALICHVGFVSDDGQPIVIPTIHARLGDQLLFHGARASRLLRALAGPVCVTVTLVDGLVLARSLFHHSMNYRSVVVMGVAEEVTDPDRKRRALDAIVEHVAPGRSAAARGPSDKELAATRVMALPLGEVSAKVRTGPPIDEPEDMELDCWAGVVPLALVPGEPIAAPDLLGAPAPPAPAAFARRTG